MYNASVQGEVFSFVHWRYILMIAKIIVTSFFGDDFRSFSCFPGTFPIFYKLPHINIDQKSWAVLLAMEPLHRSLICTARDGLYIRYCAAGVLQLCLINTTGTLCCMADMRDFNTIL